jgi:hypothetical protein
LDGQGAGKRLFFLGLKYINTEVKMAKIELTQTASGGIQVEIKDGNSTKFINLTPAELKELSPRLSELSKAGDMRKLQDEIEKNPMIMDIPGDEDTGTSDADDNDFIPD